MITYLLHVAGEPIRGVQLCQDCRMVIAETGDTVGGAALTWWWAHGIGVVIDDQHPRASCRRSVFDAEAARADGHLVQACSIPALTREGA